MNKVDMSSELFFIAFSSLSKRAKKAFLHKLLDNKELREDLLDLAILRQRKDENGRPFSEYLEDRRQKASRS